MKALKCCYTLKGAQKGRQTRIHQTHIYKSPQIVTKSLAGTRHSAFGSTLLAASLATTLGALSINNAAAQTDTATETTIQVDSETCQTLSNSTALDQESITTRIACYSQDVEHLNGLVSQLMVERDELITTAESQSASIDEYKQELANRQDAMQRLEERAASLRAQIDEVSTDRNRMREQLFNVIAEGKQQPVEVEANKILFENFSESYVTLTNEIEELRKRPDNSHHLKLPTLSSVISSWQLKLKINSSPDRSQRLKNR